MSEIATSSIAELAAALAKAQGAFTPVTKGKTASIKSEKGSYDYSYATLDELIAATRPALSANGIACVQHARTENQRVIVVTELLHASGQRLPFPEIALPCGNTPQAVGSALTYARRYSLGAALGVAAEEDDDGRAAQDSSAQKRERQKPAPQAAKPVSRPDPLESGAVISDAQRTRLWTIAKNVGWSKEDVGKLLERYGFSSSRLITKDKYDDVIEAIETGSLPASAEEPASHE